MYEFKQSVKIDGETFRVGKHEVPEHVLKHPDFAYFVKCGWIAEAGAQLPPETFAERAQRLAKKLAETPVREQEETEEKKSKPKRKNEKGE